MDSPWITRVDYGARDSIVALLVLALTILMLALSAVREWSTGGEQVLVEEEVRTLPAAIATHRDPDSSAAVRATP
jgi:hypothetical protein